MCYMCNLGGINNLEGQQIHNVQEVHKQPFENQHKIWGHRMRYFWKVDLDNNKLVLLII